MNSLRATLALSVLLPAGCQAVDRHDYEPDFGWENPELGVELFYDEVELEEIEFDEDLETIFGDGIGDVERRRAGVRVTYGTQEVRGYGQLFGEEIDDFDTSELVAGRTVSIDDLVGIGAGIEGAPVVEWLSDDARLVFVYRADVSLVTGDGTFTDSGMMSPLASPREKDDLSYFDQQLQAGLGIDVHGLRPSIGIYSNFVTGRVDDDIVASNANDDLFFEGFNTALYAELVWQPPDVPVQLGVRVLVGDVEGVSAFLGATF